MLQGTGILLLIICIVHLTPGLNDKISVRFSTMSTSLPHTVGFAQDIFLKLCDAFVKMPYPAEHSLETAEEKKQQADSLRKASVTLHDHS